jgi:hypothetical protein
MDMHPENAWVAARLAALTPTWNPNLARARAAIDLATTPRRRAPSFRFVAAAAAALVAAVLLAPSGRAVAQELWYRLFVTRVAVVRLDLSKIPLDTNVRQIGGPLDAASVANAAAKVGFTPVLPPAGVIADTPRLSIVDRIELTQTIRTAAFEQALATVGATDIEVPAEWEGVQLRGVIGPAVVATYAGDVEIVQTPPIRLEMPAGFPMARFAEAAFRTTGLSWWEARKLGEEYAARPAWLMDVPADELALVETIEMAAGRGVVVEEPEDGDGGRTTVILSGPSRIYTVSSPSRELSLRLARALPRP